MRPSARLLSGKTNVNAGRTDLARLSNLIYAVVEQIFLDLHDPAWRADAERFFDAEHADHRAWCCGVLGLEEGVLWELYARAQERLLAAGPAAVRPGPAPDGSGLS